MDDFGLDINGEVKRLYKTDTGATAVIYMEEGKHKAPWTFRIYFTGCTSIPFGMFRADSPLHGGYYESFVDADSDSRFYLSRFGRFNRISRCGQMPQMRRTVPGK